MLKLIRAEILKMRRSMMSLIGFAGAAVTPVVTFTGYMLYRERDHASAYSVETLLSETSLYMVVLIGTPLFGVLATWVFNREFAENTLKNLLVVPVSRLAVIASKVAVLFGWVLVLSAWSWLLAVVLGLAGGFSGFSADVLLRYLVRYLIEGVFLFLLLGPIIFATLAFRNYVPVIVLAVCITLVSVVIGNSEYRAIFPWTAILPIMSGKYPEEYPRYVPWVSIFAASFAGFAGSIVYFKRMDVN